MNATGLENVMRYFGLMYFSLIAANGNTRLSKRYG